MISIMTKKSRGNLLGYKMTSAIVVALLLVSVWHAINGFVGRKPAGDQYTGGRASVVDTSVTVRFLDAIPPAIGCAPIRAEGVRFATPFHRISAELEARKRAVRLPVRAEIIRSAGRYVGPTLAEFGSDPPAAPEKYTPAAAVAVGDGIFCRKTAGGRGDDERFG